MGANSQVSDQLIHGCLLEERDYCAFREVLPLTFLWPPSQYLSGLLPIYQVTMEKMLPRLVPETFVKIRLKVTIKLNYFYCVYSIFAIVSYVLFSCPVKLSRNILWVQNQSIAQGMQYQSHKCPQVWTLLAENLFLRLYQLLEATHIPWLMIPFLLLQSQWYCIPLAVLLQSHLLLTTAGNSSLLLRTQLIR